MASNKDFKDLDFEPTQKELDLYMKEKMDIYKGTFIVCLVYGIVAVLLLLLGFMTKAGKEYIFDKMLPATTTFVFGALFIIIYLSITIYDIKPRQIVNKVDKDASVNCPDYWKLKKITPEDKTKYVNNNKTGTSNLFDFIKKDTDVNLKYKCEYDPNIQDKINSDKNNELYKDSRYVKGYTYDKPENNRKDSNIDYIIVNKGSGSYDGNDITLTNYAKFSGMYNTPTYQIQGTTADTITDKFPLVCNSVLPQLLEKLDKDTVEKNKYRCMYAKACDIPWTDIGCKYDPV